jgi:GTP-binding protein HflX
VRVQDVVTQRRQQLDPRWLIGKGKLEELVMRALQADATMLVFDHDLSPAVVPDERMPKDDRSVACDVFN